MHRILLFQFAIGIVAFALLSTVYPSAGSDRTPFPPAPPFGPRLVVVASPAVGGPPTGNHTVAVTNVTVGDAPLLGAYDSGRGRIYVENAGDASFSVISDRSNTVVDTGFGVGSPNGMAYDSRNGEIWSVNGYSSLVNVINDTNDSVVRSVRGLGSWASSDTYDSGKGDMFVANTGDPFYNVYGDTVSVISDSNYTVFANVTVGTLPDFLAYDPARGEMFVTNSGSNNVSVINDTNDSIAATISVGSSPGGIAYDPVLGEVFVENSASISVISDRNNTVVATITGVSTGWQNLVYDAPKGEILVLTDYRLTAVNASTRHVVAKVPLGNPGVLGSQAIAYDPHDEIAYVVLALNSGGYGRVTLVADAAYAMQFKETGLPHGTTWWVNGTGGPVPLESYSNGAGNTTTIWMVNGSYTLLVATNKDYAANASLLNVNESGGSPSNKTIAFWPAFRVTFHATGVPRFFGWWVTVAGQLPVYYGYFGVPTDLLPNGTYNYTVGVYDTSYRASGGTFMVAGSALTVTVNFTAVTYPLGFNERGLPAGARWYVNTTNGPYGFVSPSAADPAGNASILDLINGSYSYTIATNNRSYGSDPAIATLTEYGGAPANISVTFGPDRSVGFTETGLPSGTMWWVNVSGEYAFGGNTTRLAMSLPNGSYNYSVSSADRTYAAPPGQFTVSGPGSNTNISFGRKTYAVLLRTTGLPSGTEWYANATNGPTGFPRMNGSAAASGNVSLPLINGSYAYSVQTNDKNYAIGSPQTFSVSGDSPGAVTFAFQPFTYNVTFNESGLPSGTAWQVWLNSSDGGLDYHETGTTGALTLAAVNDSYTYRIGDVSGWHLNSSGGSYRASESVAGGSPAAVAVVFARVTYLFQVNSEGLPSAATWYVNFSTGPSGFALPSFYAGGGSTIYLLLANGSYSFNVATNSNDYMVTSPDYLVVNNGTPANRTVQFTLITSQVTFSESGLPAGDVWYVNLTSGGPQGFTLPNGTEVGPTPCVLALPNGNFSYTIQTSDKLYQAAGGTIAVNGTPLTPTVQFNRVTYAVTYEESGLPPGTEWWVNLTGEGARSSVVGTITEGLSNGSYAVEAASANKSLQASPISFIVDGGVSTVQVRFALVTYTETFAEAGLPFGDVWYVNLSGLAPAGAISGSTTSTSFSLPNGSYRFTIATNDKTYVAPGGSFPVDGAPRTISESFARVTYVVTVSERGLPTSAHWWANTTGGYSQGSTDPTLRLDLPNGTYTYGASSSDRSYGELAPSTDSFSVSGSKLSLSVVFSLLTYPARFVESGLAAGTNWSITLGGKDYSVSGSAITLNLSNGTYPFMVPAVGSFAASPGFGNLTIAGGAANERVNFSSAGTPQTGGGGPGTFLGLPGIGGYVLVGALAGAALLGLTGLIIVRRRRSIGAEPDPGSDDALPEIDPGGANEPPAPK